MRAHPRVELDPPATEAVRVDQRMHVAVELRLRQRLDDDVAFPGAVAFALPMLDRASATDAKMWTKRCDPRLACTFNREQAAAVGMTGHRSHLDGLAAECVRHVDGLAVH